ncbi:MAG: thioredoxin family protein [Lachnospiraceae bacterium]
MSVLHLTKKNFEQEVLQANGAGVGRFHGRAGVDLARWARTGLSRKWQERLQMHKICKVDVDDQRARKTVRKLCLSRHLWFSKDGQAVKREVGAKSKAELLDMLNV